jgi:hypothetical protein
MPTEDNQTLPRQVEELLY